MKYFSIRDSEVTICEELKNTKNVKKVSLNDVIEIIKNSDQKIIDLQTKFRDTKDNKYKLKLPSFITSGVFSERKAAGFESASGLMILDFDKFPDSETLQFEKNKLIDYPFVVAVFTSPSGKGLKAIIRIKYWKDQSAYKRIFMQVKEYFNSEYFDDKTSDITRLAFFSYDPDVYINWKAEVFDSEFTLDRDRRIFEKIIIKWMQKEKELFVEGNRNNYVFKIAGGCCRFGIDKENALTLIENYVTLSSDFDFAEFKTTINSAYRTNEFGAFNNDFEIHENESLEVGTTSSENTFPVEIFPESIQDIIKNLRTTLNFPDDYTSASMIYATSVAMGLSYQAQFKNGWNEIGSLYIAIVGKAGTNKTHPLNFALKPIKKLDTDSYNEYMIKKSEYDYAKSLTKKEREDELIILPESEPTWKQFLVSDFTPEALIDVLNNNHIGIGVYVDELASWFKNFNRYNNGSEEQFWLSAWSGTSITVNRKNGKSYNIPEPFISVIGTIQDGVLNDLAYKRIDNGFLDRILFVFPDDQDKKAWNYNEMDIKYVKQWEDVLKKVLELKNEYNQVLRFNSDAKNYLMDWQHEMTIYLNKPENDSLKSIFAKLEIYVIRFSLILEMIYYASDESELDEISLRSVKSATELIRYFSNTAIKVYTSFSEKNPIKKIPLIQQRVFYSLPKEFKTSEGYLIAEKNGMTSRTFQRFIKEVDLFEKIKHGTYKKII